MATWTPTATFGSVLPNGDPVPTPSVPGKQYVQFGPGVTPFPVTLTANGNDLSQTNPTFCVGQQITFALNVSAPYVNATVNWHLPDKFVNHQWQATNIVYTNDQVEYIPYGSTNYDTDNTLLSYTTNAGISTQCWYVSGNGGNVSVGTSLMFPSGKTVALAAQGQFTIYRPSVQFPFDPIPPMLPMLTNGWLQLGNASQYGGDDSGTMSFNVLITSQAPFTGHANWTQLIKRSVSYPDTGTGGQYYLDNSQFYNANSALITNTGHSITGALNFYDSPGVSEWTFWSITITDSFQTYGEFLPDGRGSIWVPLGIVTWGWGATESGTTLTSPSTTPPTYQDGDKFPIWTNVGHGSG